MGTGTPKVAFCMTTFKRPELLRLTIQSILGQTNGDFEVVICDNDPDGSAGMVVQSFNDNRIQYYPNSENLGMIRSFNNSIDRAKAEFIAMITDDDPVYPDMVETLLSLEKKYPGHGMYLAGCNWFCTDPELADFYNCKVGTNSCLAHRPVDEVTEYDASSFLSNFFNFRIFPNYLWSTAIVRREVLIQMGKVPDYGTAFLGDYAYMAIMGGHSGVVTINKALGHQTLHKQNFGRAQNEQLVFLGPKFIEYVSSKLDHLANWTAVKKYMEHFVAVWIVRHVAFLIAYNKRHKEAANLRELKACEKKIFRIPFMRPYRIKYYLLTNYPWLHDLIVRWRKRTKNT
jgi:glycosyltransferase involved in cell wall biosynthesis